MVSERLRKYVQLEKVAARIPLTANQLTILSVVVAWVGVPMVWSGFPPWLFILASAALDAIDGAVARARGAASKSGAFLDSLVDRYSDVAYLLYFWHHVDHLLLFIAVLNTFAISYTRCRGESLGVAVRGVGFMERGERVFFLFVASFFMSIIDVLLLLYTALVTTAAAYRGFVVYRQLKNL